MSTSFDSLRRVYRETLLDDVVPFWLRHGFQPDGGFYTCMDDSGRLTNRERWGWSLWRAVWVFSALHRRIGGDPRWLPAARSIYRFLAGVGRTADGHWPLLYDEAGHILRGFDSIYVDGFALYGLVEYWRASGDGQALELALATFDSVEDFLKAGRTPPAYPYPIPQGLKPHGFAMLFSLADHELAGASGAARVRQAAARLHREVMERFLRPDGLVREWLDSAGSPPDSAEGRVVVPGHAIESMWFQLEIAKAAGDSGAVRKACAAILAHLERGWDPEFGGIFLAVDVEGRGPVAWAHADTKLWWPHTEALAATLLAYEQTRDDRFLAWHERVREYSYRIYPDREHGEWHQKMDRQGRLITETVVLPVKDPFHLPRALIVSLECLGRLAG